MQFRWNWKWLAAIAALILAFFFSEGGRNIRSRKKVLSELEAKLSKLKEENKGLTLEIHHLKNDPKTIERTARKELGLIQPGEIEYRFILERSTPSNK